MQVSPNARPDEFDELPDGLVVFVKRDCETCVMVTPVLAQLAGGPETVTIFTQDDPTFPDSVTGVIDDTELGRSFLNEIETVPTVIRRSGGVETERTVGWDRPSWEAITGLNDLGTALPDQRPGCGSLSVDPDRVDGLRVRFGGDTLGSRRVEIAAMEDEMEALFDRGWSDGLPIVPPTEARVMKMLEGTTRSPDEIVATIPPDLVPATVEKIAVNAVMAGCRPEYLPVVLAAVEAACTDTFNGHGLLCTTFASGPVVIVNGPIAQRIGMNSGVNCLGQGNRANSTIGRALQLVIRNLGGGIPGEIDRAAHGNPGKVGFSFAEDEAGSPWEPLSVARGFEEGQSTVTLFAGSGTSPVIDQLSRDPESLCQSLAGSLRTVSHYKIVMAWDAFLVVCPEHARVFADAGWSRQQVHDRLIELLTIEGAELRRGSDGNAEGVPAEFAGKALPKFRPGGLQILHAGGGAGMFSTIIGGWASGPKGSEAVTMEVKG